MQSTAAEAGAREGASPRFHVQAGSFSDRANAVALMTQLRAHGYAVMLAEGTLYRVWVGGFVDRDTAERLAGALRSDGFDATLTMR
jgi:cell division septation protein DedD